MEVELHERISRLFAELCDLGSSERAERLASLCAEDATLRREVSALLEEHDRNSQFLRTPILEAPQTQASESVVAITHAAPSTPDHIGRYRILRRLGQGGMGVVYLAEQDGPHRIVALKIIQPGIATPSRLKRFEHEAEVLGRLQHPGIAQIFEAGTADAGLGVQPFFAMEYVHGESLLEHCNAHGLGTRERLALFARICEAVHHAHQKGVIHRDLKPANILVDAAGQPKILDFGVARATDSDVQASTLTTDANEVVGTLPYMSPEQVAGARDELDTRSDVYALGVVGYELLTGRWPIDVRRHSIPEAARAIREDEPTSLSSIKRTYRGDLDTIFAKALAKERARRYASAAQFGSDVERYLRNEPISARPASTAYQLSKLARRHRGLVGGVVATFGALVLGLIATLHKTVEARDQRNAAIEASGRADRAKDVAVQAEGLAQLEAKRSRTALAFLTDMFASIDTSREGEDARVIDVLRRAEEMLATSFADEPAIEASLRYTIGTAYRTLGRYDEAQRHIQRAVELSSGVLGVENEQTEQAMYELGTIHLRRGQLREAQDIFESLLDHYRQAHPDNEASIVAMQTSLAEVLSRRGLYGQAVTLYRACLDANQRLFGSDDWRTLRTLNGLCSDLQRLMRADEAVPLLEAGFETQRRVRGDDDPDTLATANVLGCLYLDVQRFSDAQTLIEWTLERRRRVLGDRHGDTLASMNNLAAALVFQGHLDDAARLYEEVLEAYQAQLGREHDDTLLVLRNLAILRRDQGRADEAERLFDDMIEVLRTNGAEERTEALFAYPYLADMLAAQGRVDEAADLYREVANCAHDALPSEHTLRATFAAMCGQFLFNAQRFADAEPWFRAAYERYLRDLGITDARTQRSLSYLVDILDSQGRSDEADPLRENLSHEQ